MPLIGKGQKMPAKLRLKLANECKDLTTRVKFNLQLKSYNYYLVRSDQIDDQLYNRLMILFESLMRNMYEASSWGWNQEEKFAEFKHSRTRIFIVTVNDTHDPSDKIITDSLPDEDEHIVGFMNFRFEIGANKLETALYVYELHVDIDHQRQGLGGELMRFSSLIAREFKMDKVMLTVFRINEPALKFYKKLKFNEDQSSPSPNEADYTILSLKMKI